MGGRGLAPAENLDNVLEGLRLKRQDAVKLEEVLPSAGPVSARRARLCATPRRAPHTGSARWAIGAAAAAASNGSPPRRRRAARAGPCDASPSRRPQPPSVYLRQETQECSESKAARPTYECASCRVHSFLNQHIALNIAKYNNPSHQVRTSEDCFHRSRVILRVKLRVSCLCPLPEH